MIFKECIAQAGVAGIVQTSRQLYVEFIPLLYKDRVLTFHIDPRDRASAVKLMGYGDETIDVLSNHRDNSSAFEKMPIDKFKSVRVLIDAPDPEDLGQLGRCWKKCTGLTQVLLPQWQDAD